MRLVGLFVLVAACVADVGGTSQTSEDEPNNGSGSGGTEQTTITPLGYLEEIARIHCEQAFACRASFPADLGYTFEAQWGTSATQCQADLLLAWSASAIESEIAKGRAEFDGAAARDCLAGVAFGACTEYWMRGIEWAESCYHVIVGKVGSGGACDMDYACTSSWCDLTTHTCS
jgi:hypothetical protein